MNGKKRNGIYVLVAVVFLISSLGSVAAAKMTMGKWSDAWESAKAEFEKDTGKKKPAKKFLGMFRKSSGIDGSLKKVDAAYWEARKSHPMSAKTVKNLEKALTNFNKKKDAYVKHLKKALDAEKDADSAYAKGLDLLKKRLKAIASSADAQANVFVEALKAGGNMRAGFDASFLKLLKSTLKNAKVFRAKVLKAKGGEMTKYFHANIKDAARDITQNLKNLLKSMPEGKQRTRGENLNKILEAWGDKGRNVAKNATEKEVKRELGAFYQAVKGVGKWSNGIK